MKKTILSILLILLTLSCLCLSSCGEEEKDDGTLKIVATLFPQYDFAKNIAGDKAKVELLLPPGADSHSFDPSMKDILKMSDADLFIYTGAEMELWSESFAKNVKSDCTVVDLSEGIDLCGSEQHGHDHLNVDPHIWTSPANAMKMVMKICDSLCEKDKENEDYYKENASVYLEKLETLDGQIREVSGNSDKTLYFGGEFSFLYFVKEYGFSYFSLYDSCSSHSEPSSKKISEMVEKMKEDEAKVLFYPELSSAKAAKSVANETGARLLMLHSCHNLTDEEISSGENYLSLMTKNLENIKEALS
ncbi:MAG: zinc ABC transporter substrate-binding protein [Ruminococcaceae bacterium]|nr:zinc ABC transporter substrate-binding protein [Oscillospiraceae bacterium]